MRSKLTFCGILLFVLCHGLATFAEIRPPIIPPQTSYTCKNITEIEFCSEVGYTTASFPNYRNQFTPVAANSELQNFRALAERACSNVIVHFLCAVYAPFCDPKQPQFRVPPCRELCEHVRAGCESLVQRFDLMWPPHLECSLYPWKVDDPIVFCPPNISLVNIPPNFKLVMCSSLSNITNGYVTYPSDRRVGSVASYECAENFILRSNGSATRTCQDDGMWSGEEPRCDSLLCSPLVNIIRGSVLVPNPPFAGSVAQYQCNEGYTLVGDDHQTCLINLTWSGKQPTCEPSPPGEIHGFCSNINWRNIPGVHCGDITGYQVKLINPSTRREVIRKVDNRGTFYVLVKDDEEYKQVDTEVQVGLLSDLGPSGTFSERISLGCNDTVMPTSNPDPSVHFELGGKVYLNNSNISISDIGEGEQALYCKTDKELCCGTVPNRFGQFYYPNGTQVAIARHGGDFYRNRSQQLIRLNRRHNALSPTGKYHCEIPDASDVVQNVFITLL